MCDLTNPAFTDENKAREFLEASRWPDGPVCPFCGQLDTVAKLGGKSMGPGWYYCSGCQDKFTVRVGTLYGRSHIPLHKWLFATHLIISSKKGMSALQLSRMLGLSYKSAWFMCHRIREGMTPLNPLPIGGQSTVVEADETFIGGAGVAFFERASEDRFPPGWLLAEGFVTDLFLVMEKVSRDGHRAGLAREKYCAGLRSSS